MRWIVVFLAAFIWPASAAAQTRFNADANLGALVIGLATGSFSVGGTGSWSIRQDAPSLSLRGHVALTGIEYSELGFLAGLALAAGYKGESVEVDGSLGLDGMSVAVLGPLNKGRINGAVPVAGFRLALFGQWVRLADGIAVTGSCLWVWQSIIWEGVGCSGFVGPAWRLGKKG